MIEVHEIGFEDNRPQRVTISMPVKALAHIAQHYGSIPGNQVPGSLEELWAVTVGTVIYPYWENGVEGCIAGEDS